MAATKKVQIDKEAFKAWVSSYPASYSEMSAMLGQSKSYISNISCYGEVKETMYRLMLKVFGLPDGAFMLPEPEPEPEEETQLELEPEAFIAPMQDSKTPHEHEGEYWLRLKYSSENVKVQLLYGDDIIVGGISKITGKTLLDFVQSISYASHMCYKFFEQRELEKKMEKWRKET